MAIFENNMNKKAPLGVMLIRKGLIKESDIDKAIVYQREHRGIKLGEAFYRLGVCDEQELLNTIAESLNIKAVKIDPEMYNFDFTKYISMDIVKQHKILPFEINESRIKVAFADPSDKDLQKMIRLILLSKGLSMEVFVTFETYIDEIIKKIEKKSEEEKNFDSYGKDISQLVDNIIRSAMVKRASDIHFEPMEDKVRVRFRIDGELIVIATIEKSKQAQVIGRLKSISNMHQEIQLSQDGRIVSYPDYNIRVSSQMNIHGEKFVLRLMKKEASISGLQELGYPDNDTIMKKCFNKRNCIAVIAAPTGEGKTTTLYSALSLLNRPEINITTVEDPVEIRIPGLNQVEVNKRVTFADSLRTILRQDPDIILLGEIRDKETAEIAIQAGQTGHFVLSTIHTVDSIEVITRLRKLGISSYDIGSVLATSIAQRLVRRICKQCAKERPFTDEEKQEFEKIGKRYNCEFNLDGKHTYQSVGCEHCNHTGFYGRIAANEILIVNEDIKDLIISDGTITDIRKLAFEEGYRPLVVDAFNKVLDGYTTIDEVKKKLAY
jgi:type IV pilus assembly protein PilB